MQKRLTTLRRSLLPARFDPTGLYADRVHQRAAAFRLLVHAEFESFLEERVTAHAVDRHRQWRSHATPSITLASLIAYDEVEVRPPSSILVPPQKPAKLLDERLEDALNRFNARIRGSNHGVREMNVLGMVLPIGVQASELDMAWLASLDAWARERGALAHQSSGKVKLQLDPAREYSTAKSLMLGFKRLDALVDQLP